MRLIRSSLPALALLALGAAPDSFTVDELEALEQEKRVAEAQLAALQDASQSTEFDLQAVEAQLISAALESRRREEQAAAAEMQLIDLRARLNAARYALLTDEAALEDLLGVLAATGRQHPPALIVSPDRANEAVRRAIVTGDAAPRLAARAEALGQEIEALGRLERDIRREKARLDAAEAVLALKEAEIVQLATAKRAAFEDVSGEAEALRRKVADLAARAEGLRELLVALEADAPPVPGEKPGQRPVLASMTAADATAALRRAPPASRSLADLQPLGASTLGGLGRPAAGLVQRGYNDRLPGGGRSEGITIVTRSRAQVVAPVDGRIEYAGKFRSYGEMLILRTSDDYHVILSGMSRIYGTPGQIVSAGEPVGQMSGRSDPPPELYIELRKDGAPMNPARWMRRSQ